MSRQKNVVNTDQVAHLWANKSQNQARNPHGNFYFTGDTIYSYGSHFPIARHVTVGAGKRSRSAILLTTRTHSSTTSGHISTVRQAIAGGVLVFHVPDVSPSTSSGDLHKNSRKHYRKQFDNYLELSIKAIKRADYWLRSAQDTITDQASYSKFFGLRWAPLTIPENYVEKIKAKIVKQRTAAKVQNAAKRKVLAMREAKAAADLQYNLNTYLPRWMEGLSLVHSATEPDVKLRGLPFAYFRIKPGEPETVETSKGAEFPLDHAKRAYCLLALLRSRGEGYHANGHIIHVGWFAVTSLDAMTGEVVAGCHRFEWTEIERFAKLQNWPTPEPGKLVMAHTGLAS